MLVLGESLNTIIYNHWKKTSHTSHLEFVYYERTIPNFELDRNVMITLHLQYVLTDRCFPEGSPAVIQHFDSRELIVSSV